MDSKQTFITTYFNYCYCFYIIEIITQQLPTILQPMGPKSTNTICPMCHSAVYTNTSRKAKSTAWWSCILLCILG